MVEASLANETALNRIDASGLLVIPSIIDTHAHVYQHVTGKFGLNPDLVGVRSAVTTVIDQGGPSRMTIGGFRRYVAETAATRVLAYISNHLVGGLEVIRLGQEIATAANLPLYIHLGQLWPTDDSGRIPDPEELIRELMPIMRAGDVLAHPFTRHPGGFVSAKTAFVSRGGHHAGNGSPGNVFGTGGADGHGNRTVTMHGDRRTLKVLMRFFTIVRPIGFRYLLWPGTNRSARAGSGPASRDNVRFVSMAA